MNRRLKTALRIVGPKSTPKSNYIKALKLFAEGLMEAMVNNDRVNKAYQDLFVFGRSEMLIDEEWFKTVTWNKETGFKGKHNL